LRHNAIPDCSRPRMYLLAENKRTGDVLTVV
jgi:hypothetical protein